MLLQAREESVTPLDVPETIAAGPTVTAKAKAFLERESLDANLGPVGFNNRALKKGTGRYGMHGYVMDKNGEPINGAWVAAYSSPFPLLDVEQGFEELLSKPLELSLEPLAAATTDEEGHFELDGVPGRALYLTARAPKLLTKGRRHVPASTLLSKKGVQLTAYPAASIEGRVVDASGTPVAGAEVLVNPGIKYLIAAFRNREFFVERVYTKADGSFSLEAVPAGMVLNLNGFASSTQPGVGEYGPFAANEEVNVVVSLDPGGTLQGKVVDHKGAGVAHASVAAAPLDLRRLIPLLRDFPAWIATTDRTGNYEFPFLPEGQYLTIALSPDGRSQPGQAIVAGEKSIAPDITIEETLVINGRVIDKEGEPVAEAMVVLMSLPESETEEGALSEFSPLLEAARGMLPEFLPADTFAITDKNGSFHLPAWSNARVRVSASDFLEGDYRFGDLEKKPVIMMEKPGAASGTVMRALNDEPVPFFTLQAEPGEKTETSQAVDSGKNSEQTPSPELVNEKEELIFSTTTPMRALRNAKWFDNPDGSFLITGLSAGSWTFRFRAEGLTQTSLDIEIPDTGLAEDIEVRMTRGAGLAGKVFDEQTGLPIGGASVSGGRGQQSGIGTLLQGFWEGAPVTETALDGSFLLEGLEKGADHIHVLADGFAALSKKGRPLEEGELREGLELEVSRGGHIKGFVVDRNGNRLARRMVACLTLAGQDFGQTGTNKNGDFEFLNMRPGSYFLIAAALDDDSLFSGNFASILTGGRLMTATVKANETTEIELVDPSAGGCEVSGTISKNGEPIAKAQLTAAATSSGMFDFRMASTRSDAKGNFVFKSLAPGSYSLTIESPGWRGTLSLEVPDVPKHWVDIFIPESEVRGRVLSAQDNGPVAGTSVRLVDENPTPGGGFGFFGRGQSNGPNNKESSTDENGYFSFEGVPSGKYKVETRQRGWGDREDAHFFLDATSETFELRHNEVKDIGGLFLESAGAIQLEVIDAFGNPFEGGFRVLGNRVGNDEKENSSWGYQGKSTLGGLEPGEWTVKVEARGMTPATSEILFVESGQSISCQLQLVEGVRLQVRVTDSSGDPVKADLVLFQADGTMVGENRGGGSSWRNLFGGGDGTTNLGSFAPGSYILEISADGRTREIQLRLNIGDEDVVEIAW